MSTAAADTKYNEFLTSLENDEYVILLQTEDGLASCASNTFVIEDTEEPVTVIPVWSSAYSKDAEGNLRDEWSEYEAVELPVEVFLTELLPYLAQEGVYIGVNWDTSLEGIEMDPVEIFRDLGLLEEYDDLEVKKPQNDD